MAYSNHFNNAFHFDDFHVLVNNIYIQDLHNFKLFFTDASTISALPANQVYRPMLTLSLAIDYWMGGSLQPLWFHVSTFIYYLLQCVLLYFFFLKIVDVTHVAHLKQWSMVFACLAATWYGLHAANAETINYISARSDSVSTFWMMLAFVVFIFYPKYRKYGVYLIPLVIGCLFKQTILVFPGLLFLYVLYFEEQAGLNKFKPCLNAFKTILPALLMCMAICVFLIRMLPASLHTGGGALYEYIITQPYVMLHYFKTFLLPFQLSADTDFSRLTSLADPYFIKGMIFIFIMMAIAFVTSRHTQTRPISFGIFWFFIALIPTSVVPLAEVMNDHRVFFPLIGLVLAAAYVIHVVVLKYTKAFKRERGLSMLLVCSLLGAHGYGTYHRNEVWRTELALWKDVVSKSPKNGRGLMNYATALMSQGRYAEAEDYFLRSLKLNPSYPVLHTNLGILKHAQGDIHEAEIYFKQAFRYGPHDPNVLYFYAKFLNSTKRMHDAKRLLEQLVKLSPGHLEGQAFLSELSGIPPEVHATSVSTAAGYLNLSLAYYNQQQYAECIEACQKALLLQPNYAAAYNNMCSAYNQLGVYDKAEEACLKALSIDPSLQLAANNLMDVKRRKSL